MRGTVAKRLRRAAEREVPRPGADATLGAMLAYFAKVRKLYRMLKSERRQKRRVTA